jgi:hypothetical protein
VHEAELLEAMRKLSDETLALPGPDTGWEDQQFKERYPELWAEAKAKDEAELAEHQRREAERLQVEQCGASDGVQLS